LTLRYSNYEHPDTAKLNIKTVARDEAFREKNIMGLLGMDLTQGLLMYL